MKPFHLLALTFFPFFLQAQNVEIKGLVQDTSGEQLSLANIIILPDSILKRVDVAGTFSARVPKGFKTLLISHTGFESITVSGGVFRDTTFYFTLKPGIQHLEAVTIEEDRYSDGDIAQSAVSGGNTLTRKDVLQMPAFMGEADLLKAIQLLPGISGGMEGTADLFVRGGAADQNLVLLDGAPVYNPGHLLGFLSVFNPDILEKVDVMNGGFPAEFGGRLSSVLDISTISRIAEETRLSADIGLVSSRMMLEQPILKDKAGFWISGRATYADKMLEAFTEKKVPYSFHEFNGKLILRPSASDQIEMSLNGARDFLDIFRDSDGNGSGMRTSYRSDNSSQTFKWLHKTPNRWQNELSMFHTQFIYSTKNEYSGDYRVTANSEMEDYGAKYSLKRDSTWLNGKFNTGFEWIRRDLSPKVLNSEGTVSDVVEGGSTERKIVQEFAAYIQQEWSPISTLKLDIGVRGSMAVADEKEYVFPEPRVSVRYALRKGMALKFNYSRMVQYIHRISNSAVSTPIDVWFPVTGRIRPQMSHQFSLAWQRFNTLKKTFFSAEGYYKSMDDLIAYEEGTNFLFNTDLSSRLIQGQGKSYGLEFLARKDAGRFTGWISYTLSWSWRQYDQLNRSNWFRARYDRRHNGAIVAQHLIGKRWAASMVWEYISGARFTPVVGQYLTLAPNGSGLDLIPMFSELNSVKLSDAHRLDLGIKFLSKPGSKFKWQWFAGVYNVYNRATPFGIVIKQDTDNSLEYSQPGLFGLLPFISFGCKF